MARTIPSRHHPLINLEGKKIGKLLVKSLAGRHPVTNRFTWNCQCDCGKKIVITGNRLTKKRPTLSCGCYGKDPSVVERKIGHMRTHKMTYDPLYPNWLSMMTRCFNKNEPEYCRYGAVGKIPCAFIKESPANLLATIGPRPPGHRMSVDRIDGTKGYYCGKCSECLANGWPLNIRWATPTQQMRNRINNRRVTINGVTRVASEWAEIAGLNRETFITRLNRGWTGSKLLIPILHTRGNWVRNPIGSKKRVLHENLV